MIITNSKYAMSEIKTSVYSVQMRLVIMNLQKHDLGGYKCISKNSIGDAEGNIRLYGEFRRNYVHKGKKLFCELKLSKNLEKLHSDANHHYNIQYNNINSL